MQIAFSGEAGEFLVGLLLVQRYQSQKQDPLSEAPRADARRFFSPGSGGS